MPDPGRTILLVEDNEDNRLVYAALLRHYGYGVREATAGDAAVELARAERPALILMDVSIPVLDGWEATALLKADPATRDIPVVAITAHAFPADLARSRAVGCDDYLAKPVELATLLATIRRHLPAPELARRPAPDAAAGAV